MNKMNWSSAAHHLSQQGQAYVMITILGVSGSTPRNSGTKMVVAKDQSFDTIGGGHLEHKCIKFAQKMLLKNKAQQHIEHFQLATNLGQCCGGTASVLFESFATVGVNIMLFGAGHVGQSLIPILAGLPCRVSWVDSREAQFPEDAGQYHNVDVIVSDEPQDEVAKMPANSYYIIMTHNHQMDFDINQAILKRGDFGYCGLIASDTKWRRFQQRFQHRDINPEQVARMNCPVGLSQVPGKLPTEVAVSIAAEIIGLYQQQKTEQKVQQAEPIKTDKSRPSSQQGIAWNELKHLLTEQD